MKKIKVFVGAILAAIIGLSCLTHVFAYDTSVVTEIDPEGYFSFPSQLRASNGSIEIKVSSDKLDNETGDYTLYSQMIAINEETFNNIISAANEQERAQYVPAFNESNWSEMDGKVVGMAVANFSGGTSREYHVLWGKLEIGGSTYYGYTQFVLNADATGPYISTNGTVPTGTNGQEGGTNGGNGSSISNLRIVDMDGVNSSSGIASAELDLSDITFENNKDYYVATSHTTTEPAYNQSLMTKVNKNTKRADISGAVEEAGSIFVWVYAVDTALISPAPPTKVIDGEKVTRPQYPTYGNRIKYGGLINGVSTNVPRKKTGSSTYRARSISVKIGRVTDNKILKKIKNKDSSGMTELLAYAKNATAELTTTIQSTGILSHENTFSLLPLTDVKGGYYYMYAVMDDENGTYYPVEDVNLLYSIGNKILVDQTSDSFKWELADDDSVSDKYISNAGEKAGIIAIIVVAIVGVFVYRRKVKKM